MPRDTVEIKLDTPCPFEGAALFFAAIAYPDEQDLRASLAYCQALCRDALNWKAEKDADFAQTPFPVRMMYFAATEKQHTDALSGGNARLASLIEVVHRIIMPHVKPQETGVLERVGGYDPSVLNMADLIAEERGLAVGSSSNIKTTDWRRAKPVAHAMAAYLHMTQLRGSARDFQADLWDAALMKAVVALSELWRLPVCSIRHIKIAEKATLEFVLASDIKNNAAV